MKRWTSQAKIWVLLSAFATASSGCSSSDAQLGGETNFVRECEVREQCGAAERCSEDNVCEPGFDGNPNSFPGPSTTDEDAPCGLPFPLDELDESLTDLAGEWSGQLAGAPSAPTPGEGVTLRLNREPLSGTIRFGDAVEIPAPVDPDEGYLVDSIALDEQGAGLDRIPLIEGFEYTLRAGQLRDGEVTLTFAPSEPWEAWCAMQTPYDVLPELADDVWACSRGGLSSGESYGDGVCEGHYNGKSWQEDCGKAELCRPATVCACDAETCWASTEGYGEPLQLQLQDDRLAGSARCGGTDIRDLELQLERQ